MSPPNTTDEDELEQTSTGTPSRAAPGAAAAARPLLPELPFPVRPLRSGLP